MKKEEEEDKCARSLYQRSECQDTRTEQHAGTSMTHDGAKLWNSLLFRSISHQHPKWDINNISNLANIVWVLPAKKNKKVKPGFLVFLKKKQRSSAQDTKWRRVRKWLLACVASSLSVLIKEKYFTLKIINTVFNMPWYLLALNWHMLIIKM